MKRVSVVILNWNGVDMLRKFIPSVMDNSVGEGIEICVADNASSDGSLEMLRSEFPVVRLIELDRNYGFAEGYNRALQQVDAEYVHLVRSYGAGQWKTYCLVKIPAAVPALLSGLKVAATYSISGAVVGEWIGSQEGLGYYLLRVKNGYMLDKVFACVAVIIFLSLCMNGLIRLYQYLGMPYLRKQR